MNLNTQVLEEPKANCGKGIQWVYRSPQEINRGVNEVLVESELKEALIRLNPAIAAQHELADEVILNSELY